MPVRDRYLGGRLRQIGRDRFIGRGSGLQHRGAWVLELMIQHEFAKGPIGVLTLRRSQQDKRDNIRLGFRRELVDVWLHNHVSIVSRDRLEPPVNHSDSERRRVVSIRVNAIERSAFLEIVLNHSGLVSPLAFPARHLFRRHGNCPFTQVRTSSHVRSMPFVSPRFLRPLSYRTSVVQSKRRIRFGQLSRQYNVERPKLLEQRFWPVHSSPRRNSSPCVGSIRQRRLLKNQRPARAFDGIPRNVLRIESDVRSKQRFGSVQSLLGHLQEIPARLRLHGFTTLLRRITRRPRLYQNTIHLYIHSSQLYVDLSEIDWHSGWGGFPHEGDFVGGQAVGFVHQVAQPAFELQGFGRLNAGRFDRSGVLVSEALECGGR